MSLLPTLNPVNSRGAPEQRAFAIFAAYLFARIDMPQ